MRQHRVDEIAAQLPRRAWKRFSAGHGAKGERLYDWALLPWAEQDGWEHALLVRRSLEQEPEYAFYSTYARKTQSTLKTLVAVVGRRWAVESAFQMAKGECGLDHYEVRHWQGWYRHITLSTLALTVLTVLRGGWHGLEHLLYWSDWRRPHQFLAQFFHYRKQYSFRFATQLQL